MESKNKNICNVGHLYDLEGTEFEGYMPMIEEMANKMGMKFIENCKTIINNGKVVKGENRYNDFNTELDEITYEIEEIYPIDYDTFKEEFPNTIRNVERIGGGVVYKKVERGDVIQGWSVKSNVDATIERAKIRLSEFPKKQKEAVELAEKTFEETQRMKEEYDIEWCSDLFWKIYAIKEGKARWNYLVKQKGEKQAKKIVQNIKDKGGEEFIKALSIVVYGRDD